MKKYQDMIESIKDTETGACIPKAEGNRHYREYLEWVAAGNTPIEPQPSPDHDLVDDVWIESLDKKASREKLEAKMKFDEIDTKELLIEVIGTLIDNGTLVLSSSNQTTYDELLNLKSKKDKE